MNELSQPIPSAVFQSASVPKVLSASRPAELAEDITNAIHTYRQAKIQAIGTEAINKAVKAIAIAGRHLTKEGLVIGFMPYFILLSSDEGHLATRFIIEASK